MIFDFAPDEHFSFLPAFAQRTGSLIQDATLTLPASLGEGTIRKVRLSADFSLLIHHYRLNQTLILRRRATPNAHEMINVLFHIHQADESYSLAQAPPSAPEDNVFAIRITSTNIDSEIAFPAQSDVYFMVVSTSRTALEKLLAIRQPNAVVNEILSGRNAFLFYEFMSAEMQTTLKALTASDLRDELGELRVWIYVQHLLCLLFERLLTRHTVKQRPIHSADAHQLWRVRSAIVADLSVPPNLSELAQLAGMSASKLTGLFRQVFGDSIYHYYQQMRMEEAAHLLRRKGYSVSETGYRLGFTNLSHFSRLFEKHVGSKPKQFARNA